MEFFTTAPIDDEEPACRLASAMMLSGGFESVTVVQRGDSDYVVMFSPRNHVEDGEQVARMYEERCERAGAEGSDYVFVEIGMRDQLAICRSPRGNLYEVSSYRCSCPDYEYRCRPHGIPCKHQLALWARRGVTA